MRYSKFNDFKAAYYETDDQFYTSDEYRHWYNKHKELRKRTSLEGPTEIGYAENFTPAEYNVSDSCGIDGYRSFYPRKMAVQEWEKIRKEGPKDYPIDPNYKPYDGEVPEPPKSDVNLYYGNRSRHMSVPTLPRNFGPRDVTIDYDGANYVLDLSEEFLPIRFWNSHKEMHENDNLVLPRKEGPLETGRVPASEWKPYKFPIKNLKIYE